MSGLEIRGCREPRAPLNSPAAPSYFCREPKNVLVYIDNTCKWPLKMQLGSLEKILISSPECGIKAHRLVISTHLISRSRLMQFQSIFKCSKTQGVHQANMFQGVIQTQILEKHTPAHQNILVLTFLLCQLPNAMQPIEVLHFTANDLLLLKE